MKLYKVLCRGMTITKPKHGIAYVVASDAEKAYQLVLKELKLRNFGTAGERELESIELIAEDVLYPNCGIRLYIEGENDS